MKILLIALLGNLLAVLLVSAQEPLPPVSQQLKHNLINNLTEATDIAIVERLESGKYKVLRVYRGITYVAGAPMNLSEWIRSDMTKEPRLLVWEKNYVGDFNGPLTIELSVNSVPFSKSDEVILEERFRIPLKELLPKKPAAEQNAAGRPVRHRHLRRSRPGAFQSSKCPRNLLEAFQHPRPRAAEVEADPARPAEIGAVG